MRARFEADGDVIVVTGGANGIGRALACAAAQAGARVVVCDVDEAAIATLSDVAGISTRRLDVADRADVFATLGEVERRFGRIDGLVCAAAIQPRSPVRLAVAPSRAESITDEAMVLPTHKVSTTTIGTASVAARSLSRATRV